jgi:integrase
MQKFAAILNESFKVGWLDLNPCDKIGQLQHSSRLEKVWSWDQEALFLAEARPDLVEAYLVAVWTALREGDCVDIRVAQYDGEFIRRALEKRPRPDSPHTHVTLPVKGPLKPIFDGMVTRTGVPDADFETRANTKILRNSQGQPWANGGSLYGAFKAECDRLGIEDRTFHDLRRTAIVRLAIAGCTESEIVSITRHTIKEVKTILEKHYLYLDPQIAINAMRKLEVSTAPFYGQFVAQFLERRLATAKTGTPRPTEMPTEPPRIRSVLTKV